MNARTMSCAMVMYVVIENRFKANFYYFILDFIEKGNAFK